MNHDDFRYYFTATILAVCLFLIIIVCGCSSNRKLPIYETEKTGYERIVEKTVTRIDTVTVEVALPPSYVSATIPDTSSYLSTDYAESTAIWSDGLLTHTLSHKTVPLVAPVTIVATDTIRIAERSDTLCVPVPVEIKLTRWQRVKQDWFDDLLLVMLLMCVWIFRKPILRIIQFPK